MAGSETYQDLEHTQKISLRTYIKLISPEDESEMHPNVIYSEGAYRIGFCFTRERSSPYRLFLTINGLEVELLPSDLAGVTGVGVLNAINTFWLDGNVDTVRDDEITYRWVVEEGDGAAQLIVLFDRVGWKKDDNYYPAQVKDKNGMNQLIGKP